MHHLIGTGSSAAIGNDLCLEKMSLKTELLGEMTVAASADDHFDSVGQNAVERKMRFDIFIQQIVTERR